MLDETSTKIRSAHVDRLYVRRSHPFRSARFVTTFTCFAIALIWSIVYGLPSRSRVHDPGPLSSAHRQWQNDCKRCHDGGEASGMLKNVSLAVSDSACLQCHDGAVHQMNQTHFIAADKSRSANCVTCHVEHKGGEALAANRDQTCVQCHRDLSSEMKGAETQVTNVILAFDISNKHPKFGLSLEQKDGKTSDPTVLQFNHKIHMNRPEIQANCVMCHEQREPSPRAKPAAPNTPPPWKTMKDRPLDAISSSDGRYTQPISYERHCQQCHPLNALPNSDVTIVHESMSVVRAQLAGLSFDDLKGVGTFQPAKPKKMGRPGEPAVSANAQAIKSIRSSLEKVPEDKRAKILEQLDRLEARLTGATDATTQPSIPPDKSLIEMYVAYGSSISCTYCHDMQGDASVPSKDAQLENVPTQIPDSPRRWFTASQFDHRAHRGAQCIACHADAKESTKTEQLLQPNIETCVTCHRSEHDNPAPADTAPSNCITCHQFHDRRLERWGNGKLSLQEFSGKSSAD